MSDESNPVAKKDKRFTFEDPFILDDQRVQLKVRDTKQDGDSNEKLKVFRREEFQTIKGYDVIERSCTQEVGDEVMQVEGEDLYFKMESIIVPETRVSHTNCCLISDDLFYIKIKYYVAYRKDAEKHDRKKIPLQKILQKQKHSFQVEPTNGSYQNLNQATRDGILIQRFTLKSEIGDIVRERQFSISYTSNNVDNQKMLLPDFKGKLISLESKVHQKKEVSQFLSKILFRSQFFFDGGEVGKLKFNIEKVAPNSDRKPQCYQIETETNNSPPVKASQIQSTKHLNKKDQQFSRQK